MLLGIQQQNIITSCTYTVIRQGLKLLGTVKLLVSSVNRTTSSPSLALASRSVRCGRRSSERKLGPTG